MDTLVTAVSELIVLVSHLGLVASLPLVAKKYGISVESLLATARANKALMTAVVEYDLVNASVDADAKARLARLNRRVTTLERLLDNAKNERSVTMDAIDRSLPNTIRVSVDGQLVKRETVVSRIGNVSVGARDNRAQSGTSVDGAGKGGGNHRYPVPARGTIAQPVALRGLTWESELVPDSGRAIVRIHGKVKGIECDDLVVSVVSDANIDHEIAFMQAYGKVMRALADPNDYAHWDTRYSELSTRGVTAATYLAYEQGTGSNAFTLRGVNGYAVYGLGKTVKPTDA